ncbi:MAG: Flp pilus assembly complex ATPase component TadA [Desulfobacterales bacterium]|nr:Flp pilus assembly complex ATPase component TadA [Desulfobacterales bacterium]MBL7174173.1 Flp pilus assembly complex ATPase component TadA [Desulfobacteraceae bacterium]
MISSDESVSIKKFELDPNDIQRTLDKASSLEELGLIQEAVSEYEKLFPTECPPTKIVPGLVACLSKTASPSKIIRQIEQFANIYKLNNGRLAQFRLCLGLETEKRGHKDLSLELYKAAVDIDPENNQIKDKIDQLLSKLTPTSRYSYLIRKGLVNADQLQNALSISRKTKKSVESVLIQEFKISKKDVGESLSLFYGCPFRVFDPKVPIPIELIGSLKKPFLLHDMWVPLSWTRDGVEILIDDPGDLRKTGLIKGLTKTQKIKLSVGLKEDIEAFIRYFFDRKTEESVKDMIEDLDLIPDISFEEEEKEIEMKEEVDESSSQVVRLVDQVMVTALRRNASDIHIEPSPITNKTMIRFRLDGVCQEYVEVPNSMAKGILSRLKIMAGIDIAEKRLPQDGKIKFRRKGIPSLDLRLATLPTAGGHEDAVLRLLAASGTLKLDDMGLSERNMRVMKKILVLPYGLILVVGPTGSGKTTTLHSALGHINNPGVKIWTAEDPVEITQPGLRQVEVKPKIGLDFARVMRAFLRADPDIIMIGEMRDNETASIGIEASLTGHLVFSTLHTNSAPETVTRLLDMGLNPLNFSDALLGVLAQRLVRRLCTNCRKKYHPSQDEFEEIVTAYGKEHFQKLNIEYTPELVLYRRSKCDGCSGTGYKGRMGIHELLEGTPAIKKLIKKEASSDEIFSQSSKEGMTTLKQDGISKVLSGLTDIAEVRRVCIE